MDTIRKAWQNFRALPLGIQILSWVVLVLVLAALASIGAEPAEEVEVRNVTTTTEESTTTERRTTTTVRRTTTTQRPTTTTTAVDLAALTAERDASYHWVCQSAGSTVLVVDDLDNVVAEYTDEAWKDKWEQLGSKAEFEAAARACAEPLVAQHINDACAGSPDVQLLARNPDSLVGQCYTIVVNVLQFDAATGPCSFRGAFDNVSHEYSFEYAGDNGLFTASEPCPMLDGIYNESVVSLRVLVLGALTYDTQIGGSTTAPNFTILGVA